jgi:hypothetical protein
MKHVGITGYGVRDEHDRGGPGCGSPRAYSIQSFFSPRAALTVTRHFARVGVLNGVSVCEALHALIHHRALVRGIEDWLAAMMEYLRFL